MSSYFLRYQYVKIEVMYVVVKSIDVPGRADLVVCFISPDVFEFLNVFVCDLL